jgi:predicted permease
LGADRAAVARQLLTESLLLSLVGAGLGFLLAVWTLDGLAALRPAADTNVWPTYARALDLDSFVASAPVGLFTLGLALLTTALCGLLPAWRTCRLDVQATLRVDTAAWGPKREGRPWRIVIAAQVALVLVLLTSAGLTIRSLARLVDRPIGIDPRGLLTFRVNLPAETYDRAAATAFFDRLRARIGSLPDVQGVARIRHVPIIERGTVTEVRIDSSADRHYVGYNAVDPEFFRLFRVPLLAGRFFEARDAALQPVAIVTESAARQMFGKATPLGRRITAMGTTAEIVGVIADVRYEPQRPQLPLAGDVYVDFEQQRGASGAYMAIRTGGDPRHQLPALRRAVAELDPEVPLYDAVTMADRLQSVRSYARFTTFVLLASAVLALSLAIVGIYGTLGYAVASRRREVGIRMALGARRSHVVGLFLRDGLKTCAIGMALGLPLAIASARAMRILLYEIAPGDPLAFAVAVVLLVSAATLACLLPSHRAAAVDPNLVLRE